MEISDNFCHYGTPLQPIDPENFHLAKSQKLEDQIVTDKQGRRRFHGAFTGGFSAGYFNTVSSEKGWKPSEFVSSRSNRSEKTLVNDATAFMDDEDLEDHGFGPSRSVQATSKYGALSVSENKKKRVHDELFERGPIPGKPVLEEFLKPTSLTVGMELLVKLGWKPGQGIGPRLYKKEKKKAKAKLKEDKKYHGLTLSKDYESESENSDSSEIDYSKFTFAPDDVQISLFKSARTNNFGLGYHPLERRNILGFGNNEESPFFKFKDKNSKIAIKGHAFGVGAFEAEDSDIYSQDTMDDYDFTLGPPASNESKSKNNRLNMPSITDALEGFHLSQNSLPKPKVYPLPQLPDDFTPMHQSRRKKFENDLRKSRENDLRKFRERLTAEQRRRIVESSPSVQILSGVKNSSENLAKNFETNFTSEKLKRFESYLNAKSLGLEFKDIFPNTFTEWEKELELEEFSKITTKTIPKKEKEPEKKTNFNKHKFISLMSSRFTSAKLEDTSHGLREGLNILPQIGDKKLKSEVTKSEALARDETKIESSEKVSKTEESCEQFVQTRLIWHPHKLLCKRFNVPNPYPDSDEIGVPSANTEKRSIFNFLSNISPFETNFESSTSSNNREQSRRNEEISDIRNASKITNIEVTNMSEIDRFLKAMKSGNENLDDAKIPDEDEQKNYGLKVSTDKPSIDLFKAIFQDSSDSENEELDNNCDKSCKNDKVLNIDTKSNNNEKICVNLGKNNEKSSNFDKRNKISEIVTDEPKSNLQNSVSKTIATLKVSDNSRTLEKSKKAKGVFAGIDFESINQYRTTEIKSSENTNIFEENESPLTNKSQNIHSESEFRNQDRNIRAGNQDENKALESQTINDSESDSDSYLPALPPHLLKNNNSTSNKSSHPDSIENIVSINTDSSNSVDFIEEISVKNIKSKNYRHRSSSSSSWESVECVDKTKKKSRRDLSSSLGSQVTKAKHKKSKKKHKKNKKKHRRKKKN